MAMTASGARYRHHSVEGFIVLCLRKRRGVSLREWLFDVMDVLADLFHDGIAAFGEQLFVFGYQVVAVGINRDNQRAELFDPADPQ